MVRSILTAAALLVAGAASAADGAAVYQKHCESCHGANGQIGSKRPIAGQSVAFVKEVVEFHPPPMDKMKLSAADTDAVARYVSGLKASPR